jgi:hypothetical protein
MTTTTHYTVRVSSAKMPNSCKFGRYVHVAVIECPVGVEPSQIRDTKTQSVVRVWRRQNCGSTARCASAVATAAARELAARLNAERDSQLLAA